ncbi:TolC family protein [Roseinatronobacter alkalisoli]|nr:TolC family protein [Roseinatronobacter sp. HJB301]
MSVTAGLACGFLALIAVVGCDKKSPSELIAISPELERQDTHRTQAEDIAVTTAGASGVPLIVVSALRSQPRVTRAAERVRQEFANVEEKQSLYFPQVSASVVSELAGNGGASPQLRFTGSQLLYDFGRTERGVARQVLLAQKAHLDFLTSVDDSLTDIFRLLAEYESQRLQLALGRDRLARMIELRNHVESRIQEGVTTSGSLIEAQRRVQTAETIVLRAELAIASKRREIEAEAGTAIGSAISDINMSRLNCGPAPLELNTVINVKKAQIDAAVAQLDAQNAQSARMPSLSVEASSSHEFSNLPKAADTRLALRVDTSMLSGGANRARRDATSRNAAAAEAALTGERQRAQRSVEGLQDTASSQRVLAEALKAQSAMLDDTRALYLQQFLELDTKSIDDVLSVEEEYHQTLLDTELARLDIRMSAINCMSVRGQLRRFVGIEDKLLFGLALRQ